MVTPMAMNFGDLIRKKLDDGVEGKRKLRKKHEQGDEDINPFRKAKKAAYEKETDHVPVEDEGSEIEELTEGEAGHTGEEKMGEGDHDVDEDEPLPAFLEKDELPSRKERPEPKDDERDQDEKDGELYPEDDEDAEDEAGLPPRKKQKRGPEFSFRRYL